MIVECNNQKFEIGNFPADKGSWLLMRLIKTFQKAMSEVEDTNTQKETKEEPEDFAAKLIQMLIVNLDEKDFPTVQRIALSVIGKIEVVGGKEVALPIINSNGVWAAKELQFDIPTVLYLMQQSMLENLKPFFSKTGLTALMEMQHVTTGVR